MNALPDKVGVVLAGGESRRFGRDKALAKLPGDSENLALRMLARLRPFTDRLVLQRTQAMPGVPGDVTMVADQVPRGGPLPALLSAFSAVPARLWLVAPCDMPFLTKTHYDLLLAGLGESPAAYFRTSTGPEPLVSVFANQAIPLLHSMAADSTQSPLHEVMDQIGARAVSAEGLDESTFLNANTANDLPSSRNTSNPDCV